MAYNTDADEHIYTGWRAIIHGADADEIELRNDVNHDAVFLYLTRDKNIGIRIGLDEPSAELERARLGLRRLAAVATKIAQAIEARQRDQQIQAEATYAELAETPAARAEASHPEPIGSRGPR